MFPESVFSVCSPLFSLPAPSLHLRLCVACGLDSCLRTIHCGRTRPPSVLCFPHSSALTSARLQEGRCLNSETNGCVREEAPLTQQSGWRTPAGRAPAISDSTSHHNNAIKGMLYIPHVVLQHKLDGDGQRSLRWIIPP